MKNSYWFLTQEFCQCVMQSAFSDYKWVFYVEKLSVCKHRKTGHSPVRWLTAASVVADVGRRDHRLSSSIALCRHSNLREKKKKKTDRKDSSLFPSSGGRVVLFVLTQRITVSVSIMFCHSGHFLAAKLRHWATLPGSSSSTSSSSSSSGSSSSSSSTSNYKPYGIVTRAATSLSLSPLCHKPLR